MADISGLFNYLTGYSNQVQYRKLLVAPLDLGRKLRGLRDTARAWRLRSDGEYERAADGAGRAFSAQNHLLTHLPPSGADR